MTKGIKTSLHEVRHAVIAALLGYEIESIEVLERFKGRLTYRIKGIEPMTSTFLIGVAPYVNRILNMSREDFDDEYWGLICNEHITWMFNRCVEKGILSIVAASLICILNKNCYIINKMVDYLDRNGKGNKAKIDRDLFKDIITVYPLQAKEELKTLQKWLKEKVYD